MRRIWSADEERTRGGMTGSPGRIVWLAVASGYFADVVISLIILMIGAQIDPNLVDGISFESTVGTVTAILLVISTGVGGWLAGRLAKQEYVLHGVLVGGIGIITMLVESLFATAPPLVNIQLQLVAIGLGGLGGWLSRWLPTGQQE